MNDTRSGAQDHQLARRIKSGIHAEITRRAARECRREMRSWALWWRRGSQGSNPERVLQGAVTLRHHALFMEQCARRAEAEDLNDHEATTKAQFQTRPG